MSTYSPDLRIELITTGDQSGVWGTTTNSNLGTIIEDAISGYVTVSVTTAAQAFTALNGVADEARNAMIRLTTTTTAPFAVYAPPNSKQYIIWNNSGYAATIYNSTVIGNTTAAGTGVTIANGDKVVVFTNGTNFYTIKSENITGTLAVVNGGTGQTSYTDGQLLIGNTVGNTLAKGTLTAGTGISVTNGAGSITIANSGVTSVSGTAPIVSSGGATPAISITQAGASTNGYLSSTDWNTFNNKQAAGSYLTSVAVASANGFTGTSSGGTTPTLTLTTSITGLLYGNGTALAAATVSDPLSYSAGTLGLASGYGDTQNPYASKTANYVLAAPNGSAGVPSFRALVASDIPALSYAPQTSGTSILYGNGSGGFSNVTVGSGLSFSGGTLSATGGGGTPAGSNTQIQFNNSGSFGASSNLTWDGKNITVSGITVGTGAFTGSAANTAVGSDALRLASSAGYNVAVGYQSGYNLGTATFNTLLGQSSGKTLTTGSQNTFVGAQAGNGATTNSNNVFVGIAAGLVSTGETNIFIGAYAGSDMTTGAYNVLIGSYDGFTAGLDIRTLSNQIVLSDGQGNLAARWANGSSWIQLSNQSTWAVVSDSRIKENVVSLSNATEKILALRPVEFDYKIFNKQHDVGFVAQEYETVFPEQINKTENVCGELAELTNGEPMLGINQNLVPYLVAAFQEMAAEIKSLKAEVAALKGV